MDSLILKGAIEAAGINDDGELLYNFTPKLKEIMPELYNEHLNFVNKELMALWEKGFININMMDDNPKVTLSAKAFNDAEISKLHASQRWSLDEIKRITRLEF